MDANEQRARELLAAEYAKAYAEPFGAPIDSYAIAVRVIAAVIAATPQAPQPVVDASQPQQGAVAWCQMNWSAKGMYRYVWTCRVCGKSVERPAGDGHPHVRCNPPTIGQQAVDELVGAAQQYLIYGEPAKDRLRKALAAHGKGG